MLVHHRENHFRYCLENNFSRRHKLSVRKTKLQQFFTDFKEIFKESLQYVCCQTSQLIEMPQITCLIVINTNTNFEICSVLMPKALVLTVIENAPQIFRK
jgi:hypothetical protein